MKAFALFFRLRQGYGAISALLFALLVGCGGYQTPPRDTWGMHLAGASFGDMTAPAKIAKRPIFEDVGGQSLLVNAVPAYMTALGMELEDGLRKPGIQIQMVGNDVLIMMVRDSLIEPDSAEISKTGNVVLSALARTLNKYSQTFIEISGYADAMRDQRAAGALTLDMAQRVAVYLVRHDIMPTRMFIIGRGSARPIAAQDDIGRLTNRRVEVRISAVVK